MQVFDPLLQGSLYRLQREAFQGDVHLHLGIYLKHWWKNISISTLKTFIKKKGLIFLSTCLNKKSFDPYGFCSTNVIPCILLIKK